MTYGEISPKTVHYVADAPIGRVTVTRIKPICRSWGVYRKVASTESLVTCKKCKSKLKES